MALLPVSAGKDPNGSAQARAAADDTTLAQFAERFYREIQARDRKDTTIARRCLDNDILPFIGRKAMREMGSCTHPQLVTLQCQGRFTYTIPI